MLNFTRRYLALLIVPAALLLASCASGQPADPAPAQAIESPTPAALVRVSGGQGVVAQAALLQVTTTPTPEPSPTPTLMPLEARADTIVWWPSAMWPPAESPANIALDAQVAAFEALHERSVQLRPRRLEGTGGIMSSLRTASVAAPSALPDVALLPRESSGGGRRDRPDLSVGRPATRHAHP